MFDLLRKFDDFLLDGIFQKISNSIQKLTGKSCFSIAKYCFFISAVFAAYTSVSRLLSHESPRILDLIDVVVGLWFVFMQRQKERRHVNESLQSVTGNIERLKFFWLRSICTLDAIFLVWHYSMRSTNQMFFREVDYIAFAVALYFSACSPLPPAKSLIKMWLESFGQRPVLAPIEK